MARARRTLIINDCAFPATFETDQADYTEAENELYARECLEEIVSRPPSARAAGCPDTSDSCAIALWAAPYVAQFYGQDEGALYRRWLRHAGPAWAQIGLNPELARIAREVQEQLNAQESNPDTGITEGG